MEDISEMIINRKIFTNSNQKDWLDEVLIFQCNVDQFNNNEKQLYQLHVLRRLP